MLEQRHKVVLCALLAAMPGTAHGKPVGGATRWVASGAGDQTDASLDAGFVAFTNRDAIRTEVVLADLATGALSVVSGAAGDASEPDLSLNVLAYRTPDGIALRFLLNGSLLRLPAEPGAAAPAVTPALATWEVGPAGNRDVAWYEIVSGVQGVLAAAGDQRAPAASGNVIAWIDDANGGVVMMHDLSRHETQPGIAGQAASVAIDGAGSALRLAVARSVASGDLDIEVWDGAGTRLAVLAEPGVQRNPRISGAWVAFEDLSTGRSQVVLWNHVTGLAFLPKVSPAAQTLGDVAETPTRLNLAFSEVANGSLDLALFTLPLPATDDGTGSDWPPPPPPVPPAHCDDGDPTVLATLLLSRDRREPQAGEVSFTTGAGKDLPVLLCIDEKKVDEAWVSFDGAVVASPADFAAKDAHVERKKVARLGEGLVGARLMADCGSELRIRVLADPGQLPDPPPAVTPPGGGPPAKAPAAPGEVIPAPAPGEAGGCGNGPAGPLALLGLAVHFAARRRPRRC